MKKEVQLIDLIICILFGLATIFLIVCLVTKLNNRIYLILALSFTIIGNVFNIIKFKLNKRM